MSFEIVCKECGSKNCFMEDIIEYDWDENPYYDGYYIYCKDCDNEKRL